MLTKIPVARRIIVIECEPTPQENYMSQHEPYGGNVSDVNVDKKIEDKQLHWHLHVFL